MMIPHNITLTFTKYKQSLNKLLYIYIYNFKSIEFEKDKE